MVAQATDQDSPRLRQINLSYSHHSKAAPQARNAVWDGGASQGGTSQAKLSLVVIGTATRGGTTTYFGYDPQGNVTTLTDSSGAVVGSYNYDAWGNLLASSGTRAGENPYRFATKESLGGMSFFGYRFYNAGTGRWINRDPLAEDGGLNLYAGMENNPINMSDDYGLAVYIKRNGNNITIHLPLSFQPAAGEKNDAAFRSKAKQYRKWIAQEWSGSFGKYHVKTIVTDGRFYFTRSIGLQSFRDSIQNNVVLTNKRGTSSCSSGGMFNLANSGFWYKPRDLIDRYAEPLTVAHEAGHLMGAVDRYNKETQLPNPGWESNIMAGIYYSKVEERNITEILSRYLPK